MKKIEELQEKLWELQEQQGQTIWYTQESIQLNIDIANVQKEINDLHKRTFSIEKVLTTEWEIEDLVWELNNFILNLTDWKGWVKFIVK